MGWRWKSYFAKCTDIVTDVNAIFNLRKNWMSLIICVYLFLVAACFNLGYLSNHATNNRVYSYTRKTTYSIISILSKYLRFNRFSYEYISWKPPCETQNESDIYTRTLYQIKFTYCTMCSEIYWQYNSQS